MSQSIICSSIIPTNVRAFKSPFVENQDPCHGFNVLIKSDDADGEIAFDLKKTWFALIGRSGDLQHNFSSIAVNARKIIIQVS